MEFYLVNSAEPSSLISVMDFLLISVMVEFYLVNSAELSSVMDFLLISVMDFLLISVMDYS